MTDPSAPLPRLQLGEAARARGIAVAPLFPLATPRARYVTLDDALPRGLRVVEVDAAGRVPELRVLNGCSERVLLYDGEELVGAKQNRILDVSVLVEAGAEVSIPVSCVERGRWSARPSAVAPARHASHPELRRRKAERLASAPGRRGAAQEEVWAEVAAASARLGVTSPTEAQSDAFVARGRDLDALAGAFPPQPGQCGALVAMGGRAVCLDAVSRPDAFARLYPKLLAGYLLDGIARPGAPEVPEPELSLFLDRALSCPVTARPAVGLGTDLRLAGEGVVGSGLALDGELIQLSAYARPRAGAPILRPSRRRR